MVLVSEWQARRIEMNNLRSKRLSAYFRVVEIKVNGGRDVRVRNLSRQFAEAVVRAISSDMIAVVEPQDAIESVTEDINE
jgi:hypothetical protein